MSEVKIENKKEDTKGVFELILSGNRIGLLSYSQHKPQLMTIKHTVVDPEQQGNGYAKKLVEEAVQYARDNDMKINALCPYAKKVISSTPAYQDLLI